MWNLHVTWKDDNQSRVVFTGRVVVEGAKYTGDYGSLEKAKGADPDEPLGHPTPVVLCEWSSATAR
jgi:hypothetical protein